MRVCVCACICVGSPSYQRHHDRAGPPRTNSEIRRSGNVYIIGTNSSILLEHSSILLKIETSHSLGHKCTANLEIIIGKTYYLSQNIMYKGN